MLLRDLAPSAGCSECSASGMSSGEGGHSSRSAGQVLSISSPLQGVDAAAASVTTAIESPHRLRCGSCLQSYSLHVRRVAVCAGLGE